MENLLIVIDMQNDFIDGSLGSPDAAKILPSVKKKIAEFDGEVVFTKDTHSRVYLLTQEGKNLPVEHCIKGTKGWELNEEILPFSKFSRIFEKPCFGSIELCEYVVGGDYKNITIIGLCTDVCVVTAALMLKAYLPEVKITVDSACCAGITPEGHMHALETMKSCQINIL